MNLEAIADGWSRICEVLGGTGEAVWGPPAVATRDRHRVGRHDAIFLVREVLSHFRSTMTGSETASASGQLSRIAPSRRSIFGSTIARTSKRLPESTAPARPQ
jgi:hypothetical protein